MENQFTGAHKVSQITSILNGGTKTDSPYSYKRPTGSWIAVTKPINGYGIVHDYQDTRPIVTKVVKNNQVAFVCTDPGSYIVLARSNEDESVLLNSVIPLSALAVAFSVVPPI